MGLSIWVLPGVNGCKICGGSGSEWGILSWFCFPFGRRVDVSRCLRFLKSHMKTWTHKPFWQLGSKSGSLKSGKEAVAEGEQ